jgi:putative aminopeptidase FrvX
LPISRRWLLLAAAAGALCANDLDNLAMLDGASGNEGPVLEYIRKRVGGRQELDNTGSLTATFGSGKPHTLLIAGLDEPGYAVSGITDDGYLRVQRLVSTPPHHRFEDFFVAQPVRVTTAAGKSLNGVMAAPSVHLQSERQTSVRVDHPEELYVDLGARSRAETRQAGVDLLDPVTLEKHATRLADGRVSAPWISGRAGAAVLLELARWMAATAPKGTVTLAFASQQYSGNRGLARLAARVEADRIVWLRSGGSGRLAISPASDSQPALADELLAVAERRKLEMERETADRVTVPAFAKDEIWKDSKRVAIVSLGVDNAGTPVEVVSVAALGKIAGLLAQFTGIAEGPTGFAAGSGDTPAVTRLSTLEQLIGVYGVSGREGEVRRTIQALLPEWAKKSARVDQRGNLIVAAGEKPERLFLAHMDELGSEVMEAERDGKLRVEAKGGGTSEFFEWHAGIVQSGPKQWPAILLGGGFGGRARVDTGTKPGEIKAGDSFGVRKQVRPLLGRRVNARTLDDRAGCAVLLDALRSLDPKQIPRPAWFVFTVEEEIGLKGAEALAESVHPREVYAIDTFVSSDSPLENQRMAGARLGDGFVVRAIDSSGITPRAAVQQVVDLARKHGIPVQYGVTSGANDGSKFVVGGAVNVPLGWPLRYSHSPGETADLEDIEALEKIIRVLATEPRP